MFNVGIPTGRVNGILVIDVDVKKENKVELDGMQRVNQYELQHGVINTLTVQSPSGGLHYYFHLDDKNENVRYIINEHLYNRSGIGGYSIDVRNEGGYIVAPGSMIDGKSYRLSLIHI